MGGGVDSYSDSESATVHSISLWLLNYFCVVWCQFWTSGPAAIRLALWDSSSYWWESMFPPSRPNSAISGLHFPDGEKSPTL